MKKLIPLMKQIAAVGAFLLVAVLGLIVGLVFWVCLYPQQAWQMAENHFLPDDLKVTWSEVHLSIDRIKKLNFEIDFKFKDLSVKKTSPEISLNLDQVTLTANASFFFPQTSIRVKNLVLKSGSQVLIKTTPDTAEAEKPFDPTATLEQLTSVLETIRSYQKQIVIEKVDIAIEDFQYISGAAKPIRAALHIDKREADTTRITFDAKVRDAAEMLTLIDLEGSVDLSDYGSQKPFFISKLNLKGPKLVAAVPLAFIYNNAELIADSDLEGSYKLDSGWLTLKPQLRFRAGNKSLSLSLDGDVSGLPSPIRKLRDLKIHYQLPLENEKTWLESKGHLKVTAPVPLFFVTAPVKNKIETSCKCKLVTSVEAKLEADIWLGRLLSPSDSHSPAVKADFRVEKVSNAIFAISLGATLDVSRTEKSWVLEPTLDSNVHVERFKDVREILKASRIMVPAPFSVLDGVADLIVKSPVQIQETNGRYSAEAKFSADLNSPRQKIDLDAVLQVGLAADFKTVDVDFDVKVHDLQIELPPLDPVKGLPRLVRDSRIQLEPIQVSTQPGIKVLMSFKIQTTKKAAIRLLYPLADPYIPISVTYEKEGENEKGSINIEAFKIKYLKRVVFVDSLKLKLNETADADFPIDGRFHVNQTNYKVGIRVTGTTQKPNIDLSSDPDLERADIVSVLLFDRTRENLVGGDAETSGNAQAAMADRAVGLFGLWAFASTPIRSVSYNSVTKVYSATIVLGDGLTAGIGTSLDEYTSFEIRKRLSKRWVIATSWTPSETNDQAGEVVLQWEKRY